MISNRVCGNVNKFASVLLAALAFMTTSCGDDSTIHPSNVCADVDCGQHGTCVVTQDLSAACLCDANYQVTTESPLECQPVNSGSQTDFCNDVKCNDHGTCLFTSKGETVCLCEKGYHNPDNSPLACEADSPQPENPCKDVACNNQGVCSVKGDNTPICICNTGYHVNAEDLTKCVENDPVIDPCAGITCNDKGVCAAKTDNSPICICNAGYHVDAEDLTKCVENDPVLDPCAGITCNDKGICAAKTDNSPICICNAGYHVDAEELTKCVENDPVLDPCAGITCNDKGICAAKQDNTPICICNAGYHVDAEDLTKCVENDPVIDPCAGITCNDKGICAAKQDNTPICICNAGYHVAGNGTECELDADGCKDVDCGHGTCFNANGVGVCLCEQGYHAEESKPDLCVENDPAPNPCEGQTCSGHGACVIKGDGSNEATCLCETNYINDGLSCINDDANNNYMLDKYETASDQGKDCSKTYQAGCTNFCDSFLNNHCSTKCTSDEQCINDDYFCRNDGRCAPKVFETVWTTDTDDQKIYFPGGSDHCNYRIDWGDGSSESFTKCASAQVHTYSKAGTYHVKVTGVLEEWSMSQARRDPVECETLCQSNLDNPPEYELQDCIFMCMEGHASPYPFLKTASLTQVVSFGPVKLGDYAFSSQDALTKVSEIDIPDLSGITSLNHMFGDSPNFNSNLNRWDTSTITAMLRTFGNCKKFNSPLNNWDTTHVTNMNLLFFGAESFKGDGLSEWQTPVLTSLHFTFYDTPQFDVNLSGWNVTKVTSYSNAFQNSGISQATWNDMVSKNAGWASLNKSTLGISY